MKDFEGKDLKVGDEVIFIYGANGTKSLRRGKISKIYANDEECSVDGCAHIAYFRISKIENSAIG